ncbi:unnamed protein product, partial [Timema podura]|nr:unnamed protein product [Timema podura]
PPLPYQFTRFSGRFFGIAMAEYVVSNIVNWERDYKNVYRGQCEGIWIKDKVFADYRTISDLTIGILGMGAIGKHDGRKPNLTFQLPEKVKVIENPLYL